MSDIKDETSVNIDTAAKSVDMIKDYYNREHKRNKDRIKYGIIAMLVIPIIFLTLLFVVNSSKVSCNVDCFFIYYKRLSYCH